MTYKPKNKNIQKLKKYLDNDKKTKKEIIKQIIFK
tara:strand:- start:296 stop:400 length:105 start_codon:yes stop_codon:yes gene_type:complete